MIQVFVDSCKNAFQGSGISGCIRQIVRSEIRQEIPTHGVLRSVIPQPPPFGLRHGVLAQRTLCCEPRSFEEAFLFAQLLTAAGSCLSANCRARPTT
jgi:hypothetical protein